MSKIEEIKLLLAEGEFEGQKTIFQRISDRTKLKMILPYINEVRKEFFSSNIPITWEPKITNFYGKKTYEILFVLRQLSDEEIKNSLEEKKENLKEKIVNFDPDRVYLNEFEKYEILKMQKKVHQKFNGPKFANKKVKIRKDTQISIAFKKALEKIK